MNSTLKYLIIYLLVINVVTFLSMGIDKWKAKRGAWRISEGALFFMVLIGGGIGGVAGMQVFHHKTQKNKFKYGFPIILGFETIILIYVIFRGIQLGVW